MEIKLVSKPLQDDNTLSKDRVYPQNENWCVKTTMYREVEGGFSAWVKYVTELDEEKGPLNVYLYEVRALNQKIVNGSDESNWEYDIIYYIRADYKKLNDGKET